MTESFGLEFFQWQLKEPIVMFVNDIHMRQNFWFVFRPFLEWLRKIQLQPRNRCRASTPDAGVNAWMRQLVGCHAHAAGGQEGDRSRFTITVPCQVVWVD